MMKLGKCAPRFDARTLRLANYLDLGALPPIPASVTYQDAVKTWPVLLNDQIGDCAIAGPLHSVQSWIASNAGSFTPTDDEALTAYTAVSGYNPHAQPVNGENPTDVGCVMLDVLKYWVKQGIGGHKVGAYAQIDRTRHDLVKAAIYLFDAVQIGISLPLAYQSAVDWQAPTGAATGQYAPGSWGGHAVPIVGADATWLYVVSWGKVIRMSWHALDVYCDEAWAVFSPDWFSPSNVAPNGINWAALSADLASITGTAGPPVPPPINPPIPPVVPPLPPMPAKYRYALVSDSPITFTTQ